MALFEHPQLHKNKSGEKISSNHSIRVKYQIKMKLSAIYLAALTSAADEPPRGHLKRLQGLVRGSTEILNSGAFNRKPNSWIKMWNKKSLQMQTEWKEVTIEVTINICLELDISIILNNF